MTKVVNLALSQKKVILMAENAILDGLRLTKEQVSRHKDEAQRALDKAWTKRIAALHALNRAHDIKQSAESKRKRAWWTYQSVCKNNDPEIDSLKIQFAQYKYRAAETDSLEADKNLDSCRSELEDARKAYEIVLNDLTKAKRKYDACIKDFEFYQNPLWCIQEI